MIKSIDEVFEVGKKYSVYRISSMSALGYKSEIQVTQKDEEGNPIFKLRGKRKLFIMKLRSKAYAYAPLKELQAAVFEGWDQPIKLDTEDFGKRDPQTGLIVSGPMRGNACYNFVAEPLEVRAWIESGQLNPNFEKGIVVACGRENNKEVCVFPEEYNGGCAPMDRILEKEGVA